MKPSCLKNLPRRRRQILAGGEGLINECSVELLTPPGITLKWKTFDVGRLFMAPAGKGYFEMIPGDRIRYVRMGGGGLLLTDLGPCTQATLAGCMQICEDYLRSLRVDPLAI